MTLNECRWLLLTGKEKKEKKLALAELAPIGLVLSVEYLSFFPFIIDISRRRIFKSQQTNRQRGEIRRSGRCCHQQIRNRHSSRTRQSAEVGPAKERKPNDQILNDDSLYTICLGIGCLF